ncbi:MAG TPA: hypothetical protein QF753_11130 [Victivallales bacterium]|nr:hypothetical protein [Victivallales bacterium]
MNFNKNTIPQVQNKVPITKPDIAVKVGDFKQYYNGKIDTRGIISNKKMGENCIKGLLDPWMQDKFINNFMSEKQYKKTADYTLVLNGKLHEKSSPTLNIISILTLFIVPSYVKTEFDLSLELTDNKTKQVYKQPFKASFTVWKDLIFLPLFPVFWIRMDNRRFDKSMYLYHNFIKQGTFNTQK